MRVLTRNGRVLLNNSKAIAAKPYIKQWGYFKAVRGEVTALYDRCYQYIDAGAGDSVGNQYKSLNIQLADFDLSDNETERGVVDKILTWISRDNGFLCFHNDDRSRSYDVADGLIKSVTVKMPTSSFRAQMRREMNASIAEIDALIREAIPYHYGTQKPLVRGDQMSSDTAKRVVKLIHDWILDNSVYGNQEPYCAQIAYSALSKDTYHPVCAGLSTALNLMCQRWNINCVYASGQTRIDGARGANHAWNYIAFEDAVGVFPPDPSRWTPIDLTRDDERDQAVRWDWFLNTDKFYRYAWNESTGEARHLDNDEPAPEGWMLYEVIPSETNMPVVKATTDYRYLGNTLYGIDDWESMPPASVT